MLVAHLVVKDEADRYLSECLSALAPLVDRIHVFDDRSHDTTPHIANAAGADVHIRPHSCPSFLDHEGQFRQAAWESMGKLPHHAWVVCVDADEFFTGEIQPLCTGMNKAFRVREVFNVTNGKPQVRIDGYWDRVTALRLVPWTEHSEFPDLRLGCGSVPEIHASAGFAIVDRPEILHYGYARKEDRVAKYRRYTNFRGHNPRHVSSILRSGELRPYSGDS